MHGMRGFEGCDSRGYGVDVGQKIAWVKWVA